LTVFVIGADTRSVPNRNLVYEALVLRTRESPAGDRILTIMTAEEGLIDVFVFGGPKSKLRSLASPFASGRAFIYADPAKDFRKLNDFEVRDSYPALREELGRLWAAGLVAELLIKTSGGGGDFPPVLELGRDTLRSLDAGMPQSSDYAVALFLWRLVGMLGLGPDANACVSCGRRLEDEPPSGRDDGDEASHKSAGYCTYSFGAEGFLCASCTSRSETGTTGRYAQATAGYPRSAKGDLRRFGGEAFARESNALLPLAHAVLKWLRESENHPFNEAVSIGLDEASLADLKTLVFGLARRAAEAPIASLASGFFLP
jgi:DNA repair protein RecO (recombination protein O)